jgi:hypothetical protein
MPKINHPNFGDLQDYEYLQGTMVTIDSATDACTVSVAGAVFPALIFYH